MKLNFGFNKDKLAFKLAVIALSLFSLNYLPYGYYTILRIAISVLLLFLAYDYFKKGITVIQVLLLILVLIFQPLHKFAIGRPIWQLLEIFTAISMTLLIFITFTVKREIIGR